MNLGSEMTREPSGTDSLGIENAQEFIDAEKPDEGLELHIGSNVFRNTNGVVKLQGKEQLVLEIQTEPPALMLTMDLYDEQGTRVGHVRRNRVSPQGAHRFAVAVDEHDNPTLDDHQTVRVSDQTTGQTVLEVRFFQKRKLRIPAGAFHTSKGELVTITPHYCRIGSELTLFGNVAESRGGIAAIG